MTRLRWLLLIGLVGVGQSHAAGGASWLRTSSTLADNSITHGKFASGVLVSSAIISSVDGDQSTTSTAFVSAIPSEAAVTFTLDTARTVTAVFSGACWLTSASDNALIGCSIDGDNPGNDYVAFTSSNLSSAPGFVVGQRSSALAAGSHTIKIVVRTGNASNAATFRNRSLAVWILRP